VLSQECHGANNAGLWSAVVVKIWELVASLFIVVLLQG